ncbi:phosphohydrolase, partial [Candidatus Woesearchaeota archaeon CG_4_10_14_0_8_um_filter_47_5]
MAINISTKHNKKLKKALDAVNNHAELLTYLKCSNIMAVDRLSLNDHGPVHITIVANIALKLLRNLIAGGVTPSIVKNYEMENDDAEMVVFLAAVLHDTGHIVTRENHHHYSIPVSLRLLPGLLEGIYEGEQMYVMISEILHAIVAH